MGEKLKTIGTAVALTITFATKPVIGAVCGAGTYLQDRSCVICGSGFYCPGDDIRYNCPTDTTNWNQILTDMGYEIISINIIGPWSWSDVGNNATRAEQCHTDLNFSATIGTGYMEPWFNGTNYDTYRVIYWYGAATGYYLSGYWFTSWASFYHSVKQCTNAPANAHYTGPGTPDASDSSVVDANDCPWACDDGYGRVDNSCVPLCDAGISHPRVGNLTLPLFPRTYSSPTLAVGIGGRVCYGVLYPGRATGAINININGTIYHGKN